MYILCVDSRLTLVDNSRDSASPLAYPGLAASCGQSSLPDR